MQIEDEVDGTYSGPSSRPRSGGQSPGASGSSRDSRKRQNDGMLKTPRKKEKNELLNEASKLLAESNRGGVSPRTVKRNVQYIANMVRNMQTGEAEQAELVAALQEEFLPRNNNNNNNNNKNKVEVPSADFVSQRTHLRSVP